MTAILVVSLYFFAGCAILGMLAVSVIAATSRRPGPAVAAAAIAVFTAWVLITAAVRLR